MIGPSKVDITEFEIGDQVKVVSEDGSFTAIIEDASEDEGITFASTKDETSLIIAFEDLPDYDFYPRGSTIQEIAQRRKESEDPDAWKEKAFAEKEQLLKSSKNDQPNVTETTIKFFELFERFENLSIGDHKKAEILISEMKDLVKVDEALNEALVYAINERARFLKEAAAI